MDCETMDGLRWRLRVRFLDGEAIPPDAVIDEFLQTIHDRLLIRLDADEMPERGCSIVVDATMKALRLRGYEGSRSETDSDGGSISNTFIDDALDSYKDEIAALKLQVKGIGSMGVKFL